MNDAEYQLTQDTLISLSGLIAELSLDQFTDRISHTHSVGPILDPTLYRRGSARLVAIETLARRARDLRDAYRELQELVAKEQHG